MSAYSGPRAKVAETDQEISASVEETNRIRALLGLKPLNVASRSDKEAAERKRHREIEDAEREKRAAALAERVEKSRRRREEQASYKGSLGEVDAAKEGRLTSSAADWVKKSRKVTVEIAKRRAAADRQAKLLAEQEAQYDAASLAGLKVLHKSTDFVDGETILTLKDTTVLGDDDDALENVTMAAAERTEVLNGRRRNAGKPVYSGVDDSAFDAAAVAARKKDQFSNILPQFDGDDEDDKEREVGLVLTGGAIAIAKLQDESEAAQLAAAQAAAREGEMHTSLSMSKHAISDYVTTEELTAFKKPKKKVIKFCFF